MGNETVFLARDYGGHANALTAAGSLADAYDLAGRDVEIITIRGRWFVIGYKVVVDEPLDLSNESLSGERIA